VEYFRAVSFQGGKTLKRQKFNENEYEYRKNRNDKNWRRFFPYLKFEMYPLILMSI